MDVLKIDAKFLDKQEEALSQKIKELQPEALATFTRITKITSLHSFHAHIGAHNNKFVDSIRTRFIEPEDFISQWISGLVEKFKAETRRHKESAGSYNVTSGTKYLIHFLKDPTLRKYILTFLTRNFYRNYKERVRAKPDENLWSLWFGDNHLTWGLLIAPALRLNEWANDKSEMRRAEYNYWTVRHVMSAGLIDPESENPIEFRTNKDFSTFYRSVLKRVSNSIHEKEISERYITYLNNSNSPKDEPFLIPELRYAGKDAAHKYRLDFAVLNPYTMKMTGFEISPSSTHMAISGIKSKTQREINEGLAQQWDKEMAKRNEYFSKYGISVITFTDENLKDMDSCFALISNALSERGDERRTLKQSLDDLESLTSEIEI